jgi:hypothetical protein
VGQIKTENHLNYNSAQILTIFQGQKKAKKRKVPPLTSRKLVLSSEYWFGVVMRPVENPILQYAAKWQPTKSHNTTGGSKVGKRNGRNKAAKYP